VGGCIKVTAANPDAARKSLALALLKDPLLAAETLGHVDYRYHVGRFSQWLSDQNDPRAAAACRDSLHAILTQRNLAGDPRHEGPARKKRQR
jgi:hypothetical protein